MPSILNILNKDKKANSFDGLSSELMRLYKRGEPNDHKKQLIGKLRKEHSLKRAEMLFAHAKEEKELAIKYMKKEIEVLKVKILLPKKGGIKYQPTRELKKALA